jgi:CubicO group peptidase (beta-lactamase class C family)
MKFIKIFSIFLIAILILNLNQYSNGKNNLIESVEVEHDVQNTDINKIAHQYQVRDNVFDKIFELLMKIGHFSAASTGIIKDGEIVYSKGYGYYDREQFYVPNNDTIFLVASISKTITSTAIMQLIEKGYLDLDDDINEYLPFRLRNPKFPDVPITIRMLLSHSSSLARDFEDTPNYFCKVIPVGMEYTGYPHPFLKNYLTEDGLYYNPLVWADCEPESTLYYANMGYALLGYLIEIVTGLSYEEYCMEYIFDKLEMKDSSFTLDEKKLSRIAVPYEFTGDDYKPLFQYELLTSASGGLRTTIDDLGKFISMILNNGSYKGIQIINNTSIELMQRPYSYNPSYSYNYGFGWMIWNNSNQILVGHTGGLYGVSTKMVINREEKSGIIIFTNNEVDTPLEIIAFDLMERFLFQKAVILENRS